MKMTKQFMCGTMSLAMLFSLSAPAKAATAGSPQETPVEVAAEAATFNVTIPTQIALEQKADATVICPSQDAVKIVNHSPAPIKVTEISVKNGAWTLADYNGGSRSKLAKEKVNAKKLGLQLTANGNAAATSTDGDQKLSIDSSKWTLAGTGTDNSELPIAVSAIATAVSSGISAAQTAASVVFTVAWDDGSTGGADIPNVNAPLMQGGWYEGQIPKDQITKISFKNTYVPTGAENETWNAGSKFGNLGVQDEYEESIKCYRTGTEVIIAGNGAGKILATPENSMFNGFEMLESIENLKLLDTSHVTDMPGMFFNCHKLTSLDVSYFDTSEVRDMNGMFYGCSGLTNLDVSGFDTSHVTNIGKMFFGCTGLTSLNVSNFDTSQVTDMNGMFYGCIKLTSLDVSHFDTSQVTDMSKMFGSCKGLTSLDISNFDTSKVTKTSYMFRNCAGLTTIYVGEKWSTDTNRIVDGGSDMFLACKNLPGYGSHPTNFMSARTTDKGGYLTYKPA